MPRGFSKSKNPELYNPAPQEAIAATPAHAHALEAAERRTQRVTYNPTPAPVLPSPAVIKLQEQVVDLVGQRTASRKLLLDVHAELFAVQARFQAAEAQTNGYGQEIQERMNLIAQLENRAPVAGPTNISVMPMPNSLVGVTSEPAGAPAQQGTGNIAMGPLMTRRDVAAMM
jgi:hypothetical protein